MTATVPCWPGNFSLKVPYESGPGLHCNSSEKRIRCISTKDSSRNSVTSKKSLVLSKPNFSVYQPTNVVEVILYLVGSSVLHRHCVSLSLLSYALIHTQKKVEKKKKRQPRGICRARGVLTSTDS